MKTLLFLKEKASQYIGYPYVLPFINGFFKNLFKSLNVNFIDASWFISIVLPNIRQVVEHWLLRHPERAA